MVCSLTARRYINLCKHRAKNTLINIAEFERLDTVKYCIPLYFGAAT